MHAVQIRHRDVSPLRKRESVSAAGMAAAEAPPIHDVGLGRAVPATVQPPHAVIAEACDLALLVGGDEPAAALVRQLSRLVSWGIPAIKLVALFERWLKRLQDLPPGSGCIVRIRQRISRGRHWGFQVNAPDVIE